MIGTGVKPRWIEICARRPTRPAPPSDEQRVGEQAASAGGLRGEEWRRAVPWCLDLLRLRLQNRRSTGTSDPCASVTGVGCRRHGEGSAILVWQQLGLIGRLRPPRLRERHHRDSGALDGARGLASPSGSVDRADRLRPRDPGAALAVSSRRRGDRRRHRRLRRARRDPGGERGARAASRGPALPVRASTTRTASTSGSPAAARSPSPSTRSTRSSSPPIAEAVRDRPPDRGDAPARRGAVRRAGDRLRRRRPRRTATRSRLAARVAARDRRERDRRDGRGRAGLRRVVRAAAEHVHLRRERPRRRRSCRSAKSARLPRHRLRPAQGVPDRGAVPGRRRARRRMARPVPRARADRSAHGDLHDDARPEVRRAGAQARAGVERRVHRRDRQREDPQPTATRGCAPKASATPIWRGCTRRSGSRSGPARPRRSRSRSPPS